MWGKTQMIYLDNAATTKLCPSAWEALKFYSCTDFFNPSASYRYGLFNAEKIENAKDEIRNILNMEKGDKVIFCSCATEANNTVILSHANKQSKQMIFSMGEHPSVFNVAKNLLEQGFDVKFVGLQKNGEIDYSQLETLLQNETTFVSIMAVSNETGAINDLARIRNLIDRFQPQAKFHSDIVQAFGKVEVDFDVLDYATISAHKIYGPKGIGALCMKNGSKLKPLLLGGGQEGGLRSGTENIASIMAFYEACKQIDIKRDYDHVSVLRQKFVDELKDVKFEINGNGSPYVLSLSFEGIRGETLMNMCQDKDVIFGLGSACSSKKVGNRVLDEMKQKNIIGSIRISFSRDTSIDEVVDAGKIVNEQAKKLYETLR